jgi:HlyD family secretion protein
MNRIYGDGCNPGFIIFSYEAADDRVPVAAGGRQETGRATRDAAATPPSWLRPRVSGSGNGLFRAAALKQLTSPDDLDRMVRVTRPIGWVAGLIMAVLLVALLGWSILGQLPSRVPGQGLLLPQGGRVIEVQSRGTGVLIRLLVAVGDRVAPGQPIGLLGETDGEREIVTLRSQLAERQRDLDLAHAAAEGEQRSRAESLRRQRAAIELREQTARSREQVLRERVATTESLFREQLVTRGQLIAVQNELAAARQELSNAASDAARLGAEDLELQRIAEERLRERQRALDETARRLAALEGTLADQLTIRSPSAGTVLEVRAQPGSLLRQGQALLALDQSGQGLEVIAFVDSQHGKRLAPGMEARIAIASARREEVGMLEAEVASVSDFPLSFEAVRAMIQNEELARTFMRAGPPFLVRLRLRPDPESASGYRWTSRRGRDVALSSGILANIQVVTDRRRPIAMVIPALRDLLAI